jgi:hypothetical protein
LYVHQGALTLQLKPFAVLLHEALDQLQKRDIHNIFAQPVSIDEVPDYLELIHNPMDFSTMRHKIDSQAYTSVDKFNEDFQLIISNCMTYNSKDTIFYKSAVRLRNQAELIMDEARRMESRVGYDPDTWLHLLDRPQLTDEQLAAEASLSLPEFDDSVSLDEQLSVLLSRLEHVEAHHHNAKSALMKQLQKEIKRVRQQLALSSTNTISEDCSSSGGVVPLTTRHSSRLNTSVTSTTPRSSRKRPEVPSDSLTSPQKPTGTVKESSTRKPAESVRRSARKRLRLNLGDFSYSQGDSDEPDTDDYSLTEGATNQL